MTLRDSEGLIARIRHIRRVAAPARERSPGDATTSGASVQALERRLMHLEGLVEGLQDSVHRESERHAQLIAELQEQVQPAAMGAALSRDARARGLS